jgi:MerR family transcriptional regulator, light-induced transcriptional regulator
MRPDRPVTDRHPGWNLPDAISSAIDDDVIPRLLLSHRVGPMSPNQVREAAAALDGADVEHLCRLLRGASDTDMDAFIAELLEQGHAPDAVYLDLLAPAARRLGDMWSEDTCTFVEVSVALGRMQKILRNLSQFTDSGGTADPEAPRVLLAGVPGEQHTLGMFMVAEFFVKAGWLVEIGPPFVRFDLSRVLRDGWYDVVGFSAACDTRMPLLVREISRARRASLNRDVRVLVGGRAFADNPELFQRVGADGMAMDASLAPQAAQELMGGSRVQTSTKVDTRGR